jgi:plastocyanin
MPGGQQLLESFEREFDLPPGTIEFQVTIGHTFYYPNCFEVYMGDTVKFLAIAAPGTANHNHGITIDEFDINEAVVDEIEPTVIEFVANKKGSFEIYCATCWEGPYGRGHPDIRATLVVK